MIYAKTNPKGVDFAIDRMQTRLETLSWDDKHIYGRMYLNTINGKVIAEAYKGNDKYQDVFVDKKKAVIIGFIERGNVVLDNTGKVQTSTIDIVCTLNLKKISNSTERIDEEALQEVLKIVQKTSGWLPERIRKGNVKEVFNFMDTANITFRDMQPHCNFVITCKVNYLNNIC